MEPIIDKVWNFIWNEEFWLPKNISWKDLENTRDDVYYPQMGNLIHAVCVGVVIQTLRFICERYLAQPVGLIYIKETRQKAKKNEILENMYRKNKRPKEKIIEELLIIIKTLTDTFYISVAEEDDFWSADGPSICKKTKTSVAECIIHCTDDTSKLVCLSDLDSWKVLLNAAKIRDFHPLLDVAKSLAPDEIPSIQYHRKCRCSFTLKKSLQSLIENCSKETETSKISDKLPRDCSSSIILDKKCIFCDKITKYKNRKVKDKLVQCQELRADETIRKMATEKLDKKILSLVCSTELIAAEAHYHTTCYRDYTRPIPECKLFEPKGDSPSHDSIVESRAYEQLYSYIRVEVFEKCQIVTVAELTLKLVSIMKDMGVNNVSTATKKHIRRNLEAEFGESIDIIPDEKGKLLLIPECFTIHKLAIEYMKVVNELNRVKRVLSSDETLKQAGLKIRSDIKAMKDNMSWPPRISDLTGDAINIPSSVYIFLKTLLTGASDSDKMLDGKSMRIIHSIGQDFVYCVSSGNKKTPKHILLPFVIKSLTGNVELIKILNCLGHCVSYATLLETDTALAMRKLLSVPEVANALPDNIFPDITTTLVFDNIDRLEETLTGGGTTHRVNGIAVQQGIVGPLPEKLKHVVVKTKRRSLDLPPQIFPAYNMGQRCGPQVIPVTEIDYQQPRVISRNKDFLWCITRKVNAEQQIISSWTGFNIQLQSQTVVQQDIVGYLPTIDAPATEMSTVYEILSRTLKVKDELNLSEIVVVFDQAIYAKAVEIMWKHKEQFKPIVARLGAFHTTSMLLSVIGKRFADAGLKDLCVEAGIIMEGSVNGVMEGRHYNRAVRLHKLVYEALMRVLQNEFQSWLSINFPDKCSMFDDFVQSLKSANNETVSETYGEILGLEQFVDVATHFKDFQYHLRHNNGTMSAFWMSYIDLVQLLLDVIRASREGNWDLHLASIRQIIPWSFAYDRINYARYLPWYLNSMLSLPDTHPNIHLHLKQGGFSTQLGYQNTFGRIPMDQTIEETANKDTQTAGGTKGFSLKPGTVMRYYLTADYRSECVRQLREMTDASRHKFRHPDLSPSRIKRDENDVSSLVQMLEDNWNNPFSGNDNELVSLSTATESPPDLTRDLLDAFTKGEEAYQVFLKERLSEGHTKKIQDPLKKLKLKTFSNIHKERTVRVRGQSVILKTDSSLFGKMTLIAQSRKLEMKEVLKHPLGPLPWSLAAVDGGLRKTNKSTLGNELEKMLKPEEIIPQPSACIIDAMRLVQSLKGNHKTFSDLALTLFSMVLAEGFGSTRIDVVFDVYKDCSIKQLERAHRGAKDAVQIKDISGGHRIQQWKKFVRCQNNKRYFILFLCEEWRKEKYREKLQNRVLYLGFEERCVQITSSEVKDIPELFSNQEEADTRMILHAQHSGKCSYASVIVSSDDTDVLLLLLAHSKSIATDLYMKRGTQSRKRYININKLTLSLGLSVSGALPSLHAFTGCDTVEAFSGRGKLGALRLMKKNTQFQTVFNEMGNEWTLSSEMTQALEAFTCALYGSNDITDINHLRYIMFCAKKGTLESNQLPPCKDSLQKHIQRSNYQAAIWKRCLLQFPEVPNPHGYGWKVCSETNIVSVDWMDGSPAPDSILEFLSCKCTKSCIDSKCVCISNGLKCTEMCRLVSCENQGVKSDDINNSDDTSFDFDDDDDDEYTDDDYGGHNE